MFQDVSSTEIAPSPCMSLPSSDWLRHHPPCQVVVLLWRGIDFKDLQNTTNTLTTSHYKHAYSHTYLPNLTKSLNHTQKKDQKRTSNTSKATNSLWPWRLSEQSLTLRFTPTAQQKSNFPRPHDRNLHWPDCTLACPWGHTWPQQKGQKGHFGKLSLS